VQPATTTNNVHLNPTVQLPVNMPTNTANQPPNLATTIVQPADHKFKLVIYSISECPSGTSRPDRLKHDMDKSVSALSKVNEDIIADLVRDCIRLGSYKKELNCTCPILIKLNRAMDVISVLSNLGANQDKSISIKPDMIPDERKKEGLLLKERWSLLQSGIDKADIKIRSSSIYFKGEKHGYVSNLVFHLLNASPPAMSVDGTDLPESNGIAMN